MSQVVTDYTHNQLYSVQNYQHNNYNNYQEDSYTHIEVAASDLIALDGTTGASGTFGNILSLFLNLKFFLLNQIPFFNKLKLPWLGFHYKY